MHGVRHLEGNLRVCVKGFVDVLQTRWALNLLWDGEAKSHSFIILYVRVLSNDDHLKILERDMLEGIKD